MAEALLHDLQVGIAGEQPGGVRVARSCSHTGGRSPVLDMPGARSADVTSHEGCDRQYRAFGVYAGRRAWLLYG